jgi:hypothetical protein
MAEWASVVVILFGWKWQRGLKIDIDDERRAYLSAKQHRESIPIFERALQFEPSGVQGHSLTTYLLAFAQVALGNDAMAAQTLRAAGIAEQFLQSSIAGFRMTFGR